MAIKGMKLTKAFQYLGDVAEHKQCIPFRRFNGGVGRTAQAKVFGVSQGRWPVKSVKFIVDLLKNAKSNAEVRQALCSDTHGAKHSLSHPRPNTISMPLGQRIEYGCFGHSTHSSQSSAQASSSHLPCPWSHQSLYERSLPY